MSKFYIPKTTSDLRQKKQFPRKEMPEDYSPSFQENQEFTAYVFDKEVDVKIEWKYDDSPDTSFYGELFDRWPTGKYKDYREVIKVEYRSDRFSDDYSYFVDTNSWLEDWEYYRKAGYARHEAYTKAKSHAYNSAKRLIEIYNGSIEFYGCVVTISYKGEEIAEDSCWSFETDGSREENQYLVWEQENIFWQAMYQAESHFQDPRQLNLFAKTG
jgi:hypothetical protein